jgi:hypothetical protein
MERDVLGALDGGALAMMVPRADGERTFVLKLGLRDKRLGQTLFEAIEAFTSGDDLTIQRLTDARGAYAVVEATPHMNGGIYISEHAIVVVEGALARERSLHILFGMLPEAEQMKVAPMGQARADAYISAKLDQELGFGLFRRGSSAKELAHVQLFVEARSGRLVMTTPERPVLDELVELVFTGDGPLVPANLEAQMHRDLRRVAEAAKLYLTSEQRYLKPYGDQPWHVADPNDRARIAGMPVPWSEYVFPGGEGQELTTLDKVPTLNNPISASPQAKQHLEATISKLNLDLRGPQRVRYTYRTGGLADAAWAEISAELDMNPGVKTNYTVTIRVMVDPDTQEVVMTPIVTTYAGD